MKKKFNVEGMTCSACQIHVQKAVEKLEGVKDVNVNLLQNSMIVDYDEKECSNEKIQEAVSNAGYKAYSKQTKTTIKNEKEHDLRNLIICGILLFILMYFSMGNMMWNFQLLPF